VPICHIDAPKGIHPDAKQKMVQRITSAINAVYPIPDVRIFFQEHAPSEVSQDGRFDGKDVKPVFTLAVPRLRDMRAKRELVGNINAAIAEACQGLAGAEDIMVFFDEYVLEDVAWGGRLQSDRPEVVQAVAPLLESAA
jgi:phenylpyruvate tautomerase PptA (4-oxalocrotonate tautomerase family)